MHRLVATSATAVVLLLTALAPGSAAQADDEDGLARPSIDQGLRVMTYNLKNGEPGVPTQTQRSTALAEEVLRNAGGPDVLGAQEFVAASVSNFVAKLPGYSYLQGPQTPYSNALSSTNNTTTDNGYTPALVYKSAAFISVEAPVSYKLYTPSKRPEGSSCERVKGRAGFYHLRSTGSPAREFVFVNVHLSAKGPCASVREREFARLRNRIIAYMDHPNDGSGSAVSRRGRAHLIVMGDFNTNAATASEKMEEKLVLPSVNDTGRPINLARAETARMTMNKKWNNSFADDTGQIDHVFFQRAQFTPSAVIVQRNYTLPCTLSGCGSAMVSPSDHYPLRVDLTAK